MKKFINQDDMKNENFIDVFNLIKELGTTTRKQIEAITKLSWGAVSNITARLIESGLVIEVKPEKTDGPGRTPSFLQVDGRRFCAIGIDVNLTGISAELVNIRNEFILSMRHQADFSSREALLECICSAVDKILAEASESELSVIGIGVAMQGIVDAAKGISVKLKQCKDWENVDLAGILKEKYNIPVWLEHDPNCILLAYSENSDASDAILLRIDRGIGMSLLLNGDIVGRMGMFEIGHTLAPGGTLEDCASIRGVEKRFGKSFDELARLAKDGDDTAVKIFEDLSKNLATAIYNVQKLFNVPSIILCGEIMKYSDIFMDEIKELNPEIEFSETDVGCAAYGAALIAIEKAIRKL